MLVLRCVHGEHIGLYFQNYSAATRQTVWGTLNQALRVGPMDALGNIAALLDIPKIVAIPEMLPDTTEAEVDKFCEICAGDFWQDGGISMIPLIKLSVRKCASDSIYEPDQSNMPSSNSNYMSVWEWICRVIEANKERINNDSRGTADTEEK